MRRRLERGAAVVGAALLVVAGTVAATDRPGDGGVVTDSRLAVAPTSAPLVAGAPTSAPLVAGAGTGSEPAGATPSTATSPRPRQVATPAPVGSGAPAGSAAARPTATVRPELLTAADVPVRVEVDGVDIDQPVVATGVADTGALALPTDPDTAGWYRFGAWPGRSAGTVVVAAHVNSRKLGAGPMTRLPDTRVGARVTVTTAGGAVVRYRVTSVGSAPKTATPLAQLFGRGGTARLALVTCSGSFDPVTRSYRDNEIVWAVPA